MILNRETEDIVNREVQAGHFPTPQEFIDTAIRHFLAAREFGEEEAQKLAVLRAELELAEQQIERGEVTEYDEHTLKDLFEEVEADGMRRLARERAIG